MCNEFFNSTRPQISLLSAHGEKQAPNTVIAKNVQLLLNFVLIYCQNAKKFCFRSYSSRAKTRPLFSKGEICLSKGYLLDFLSVKFQFPPSILKVIKHTPNPTAKPPIIAKASQRPILGIFVFFSFLSAIMFTLPTRELPPKR